MVKKKSAKKTGKSEKPKIRMISKKIKGRHPSNKSKETKVKKLIKLAKSKKRK